MTLCTAMRTPRAGSPWTPAHSDPVATKADALRRQAESDRATGRDDLALDHISRARALYHALDDGVGEADCLRILATLHAESHRADRAHAALDRAITLYRDHGDLLDEAAALAQLGALLRGMGDTDGAIRTLREAAAAYAGAGDLEGEADVLMELGLAEQARSPTGARRHLDHAAELFDTIGEPSLSRAAETAALAAEQRRAG